MNRQALCAILFFLGSGIFVTWRVHAMRDRETPHFEIVEDPSASHGQGCESLVGLAGHVFESSDASPGSTLTVLVLGDQSSANEPKRMATYSVPVVRRVLEGKLGRARQRQEILQDISGKCQSLHQTSISPIFLGVTQALADLHAHGCATTSHCLLIVDSDLEENVEVPIRKKLNTNDSLKNIPLPRIDNRGVRVTFCGIAVTDGRIHGRAEKGDRSFMTRGSDRALRRQEVWRSLFAEPATVGFEPYCPRAGGL